MPALSNSVEIRNALGANHNDLIAFVVPDHENSVQEGFAVPGWAILRRARQQNVLRLRRPDLNRIRGYCREHRPVGRQLQAAVVRFLRNAEFHKAIEWSDHETKTESHKHSYKPNLTALLLPLLLARHGVRGDLDRLLSSGNRGHQSLRSLHLVGGGLLVDLYASLACVILTLQDGLERRRDARSVVRGRLDEGHVVLFGEGNGFVGLDYALIRKIALASDLWVSTRESGYQHNDDVAVGVLRQLGQPLLHILKRGARRDIVHDESADSAAIVPRRGEGLTRLRTGDGAISFLARYE